MNKRSQIHKKADSSASNPVLSQFQSRPFIAQAQPQSQKPLTQTETENREFQQQKFEATKLKLQAKYGTITSEGQERLTVLQANMSGSLQRRLEHAARFGHNFANISISRPDAPSQQALQTKLTIGEPGDQYEQEADRVASQVVNQINAPVSQQAGQSQPVQREEVSEEEQELQMKPMLQLQPGGGGMAAAPDLEASINQARGGGQPLANNIREPMEQAFGADFSGVKVHTDAQSNQLNQSIQARAFTTRQDIFFRQGEYNPGSRGGQELIAHELTHVVQQAGGQAKHKKAQLKSAEQSSLIKIPTTDVLQRGSDNTGNTATIASTAVAGLATLVVGWVYYALKDSKIRKEQYTDVIANIPNVAQEIFASAQAASATDPEHIVDPDLKTLVAQGALLARNQQMETVRASISTINKTLSEFMKSQGKTYEELYQRYKTEGATDDEVNMRIISAAGRANPNLVSKFLGRFVGS